MEDIMTGGWQYEKIDKPPKIRICYKCQGKHRDNTISETEQENWCQDCKEGKLLGHKPKGIRSASVSKDEDASKL